jgi:bacteriocin-like protein
MRELTEAELNQVSGGQVVQPPDPPPGSNNGQITSYAVHSAKEEAKLLGENVGHAVSAAAHG